ncbi:MAG: hypothetical protein HUJ95_04435 [Bacteroidales bacterium]|nr:hypothetical protein [Bacteroidales bacterium]
MNNNNGILIFFLGLLVGCLATLGVLLATDKINKSDFGKSEKKVEKEVIEFNGDAKLENFKKIFKGKEGKETKAETEVTTGTKAETQATGEEIEILKVSNEKNETEASVKVSSKGLNIKAPGANVNISSQGIKIETKKDAATATTTPASSAQTTTAATAKENFNKFKEEIPFTATKRFKVSKVVEKGAFAESAKILGQDVYIYMDPVVYLPAEGQNTFYDGQEIIVPSGKKAYQIGTIKYKNYSEEKTAPVIVIK